MRVDVHQHVWTAPLLARLQARQTPPLVRHSNGLTVLHSVAEQPWVIDVEAEAPQRRARLVHADGLDLALVAISSPIGIEALPRESALELIDAHLQGVAALQGEFAAWGPIALEGAEADQVDELLSRGCVGISVPAGALAGPHRLERLGAVLARSAARRVPLFVHPGPGLAQWHEETSLREPLWWRALTEYVVQMQAAWVTFAAFGRREHPELNVIFAMLAGGAPLLSERLQARGGPPIELRDERVFYDTSSYGPDVVEMMAHRVGESQLLYGSDRPVVDPSASTSAAHLQRHGAPLFTIAAAAA
jgi:predicted TIM-barrel fold metal-dependent hydrolase